MRRDALPRGRFLLDAGTAPPQGPGVRFATGDDMPEAKKAPSDGSYVLDGNRYHAKKGAVLPEGAEFEAATNPAPENEAATGPAENQAATGPSASAPKKEKA